MFISQEDVGRMHHEFVDKRQVSPEFYAIYEAYVRDVQPPVELLSQKNLQLSIATVPAEVCAGIFNAAISNWQARAALPDTLMGTAGPDPLTGNGEHERTVL